MFCHVLKRLQVLVDLGQEVHSVGTVLGVFILAMVEIGLIDALIPKDTLNKSVDYGGIVP